MWDEATLPLVDTGATPKFYVSGLGRVTPMGPVAMFSFYVVRPPTPPDGACRMVEVDLIAPVEAVGPAFDLAITTLGARTMLHLAGRAVGQIIEHRARRLLM